MSKRAGTSDMGIAGNGSLIHAYTLLEPPARCSSPCPLPYDSGFGSDQAFNSRFALAAI